MVLSYWEPSVPDRRQRSLTSRLITSKMITSRTNRSEQVVVQGGYRSETVLDEYVHTVALLAERRQ